MRPAIQLQASSSSANVSRDTSRMPTDLTLLRSVTSLSREEILILVQHSKEQPIKRNLDKKYRGQRRLSQILQSSSSSVYVRALVIGHTHSGLDVGRHCHVLVVFDGRGSDAQSKPEQNFNNTQCMVKP